METIVMISNSVSFSRSRADAHDLQRGLSLLHRFMVMLGLGFMFASPVWSSVVEGSKPRDWPANPAKHVIKIRRDAVNDLQKKMITAAEAAAPDAKALLKAVGKTPLEKDQWWHQEQLGIRVPFAVTAAAVDYYSKLIEGWQMQAFNRYVEPTSSLDYLAKAEFHQDYEHQGKTFKKVHVVSLKLRFSENFSATTTEGLSFEKERTVILNADGKVLAISGDGPAEALILAI